MKRTPPPSSVHRPLGNSPLQGRLTGWRTPQPESGQSEVQAQITHLEGSAWVSVENARDFPSQPPLGAIVQVDHRGLCVLSPNTKAADHPRRVRFMEHVLHPRRLHATAVRRAVEAGIREFFAGREFLETPTPLLVPCPGMEPHIRPYSTSHGAYLPTSPEFAMKRLLVGGLEKIFQLSSAFRDEPFSPNHRSEFRILEWYRAYANYEEIQKDTEDLVAFLARKVLGCPPGEEEIPWQGRSIRVATPWPRLSVRHLFQHHLQIDLADATIETLLRACESRGISVPDSSLTWDDLMHLLWLNEVEPRLPQDQACFVIKYPPSQAALAVIETDPDGSQWARRFEPYAGGLELGNAFEELTNPTEQRRRFVEDMDLREATYGASFPRSPLDEDFLEALEEGMPPSGGIAMGVDRLVMLLANEPDIGFTLWLDPHRSPGVG